MISLRSSLTKKILNYFFINSHERLYVNELSRKLALDKRNLVRKIKELEAEGILRVEKRGNSKFCSINKKYPLYKEYQKIVLKTIGFENRLRELLKKIRGIKEVYIYGSYAADKMDMHSDIDLLVIGSHSIVELQRLINKLQREIDREINTLNMNTREFRKRIKNQDGFVLGILKNKNIKII